MAVYACASRRSAFPPTAQGLSLPQRGARVTRVLRKEKGASVPPPLAAGTAANRLPVAAETQRAAWTEVGGGWTHELGWWGQRCVCSRERSEGTSGARSASVFVLFTGKANKLSTSRLCLFPPLRLFASCSWSSHRVLVPIFSASLCQFAPQGLADAKCLCCMGRWRRGCVVVECCGVG
jgi:hypothetical protein